MATKFQSTVSTGELSPEQYIMLSRHAFEMLGWQSSITSRNTIEAFTKSSFASQDQQVNITVNGNEALIESKCIHGEFYDMGRNRKNVTELTEMIESIKEGYVLEELQSEFEEFEKGAVAEAEEFYQRVEKGELTASEKMSLGVGGHKVTWTLIAICVAVFALMVISGVSFMSPNAWEIFLWGGNLREATIGGQWWRLLTCMFVHIGIVHLLFNMYALYTVGLYLEPLMGRWKMLGVYIITGLLASIASIWWHDNTVSAGASGAIFGLYGVFLALLTTKLIDKAMRQALLQSIAIFVGFNLLYGLKGNVDNAAHIGGLLSGIVFGYLFYFTSKKSTTTI